jgi:hypothetical protein
LSPRVTTPVTMPSLVTAHSPSSTSGALALHPPEDEYLSSDERVLHVDHEVVAIDPATDSEGETENVIVNLTQAAKSYTVDTSTLWSSASSIGTTPSQDTA